MKFAYLQEDKIVKIVDANDVAELLPLDKSYQNIVELTGFSPEPEVGWYFQNNQFTKDSIIAVFKNSKITKLALLNRFTDVELVMYEAALSSSVSLKILDKKLFASSYIDLSRPDTIAGIQALSQVGIISPSRATEILTKEPTELELYKG